MHREQSSVRADTEATEQFTLLMDGLSDIFSEKSSIPFSYML